MTGTEDMPGMGRPVALTLREFTEQIGVAVRRDPVLRGAWVMAEISDFRGSGGHCYMELVEKDAAGTTLAKIRANIWQSTAIQLRRKFMQATGRDLATGLKVMFFGAATHHKVYGLSFNITDVDPTYTLGDMERIRREILEALAREGVIDRNRSLPLADAPQRIAVISAPGAAGYGDFMNQLQGNPYGFVFYPVLYEAVMQGERTPSSVADALDRIEMTIDVWDCVVIIRGGGATTDLNGFDNLDLARKVACFPIPVIVGIGHERDRTVLDEIANVRMKTPTAVASFLTERLHAASDRAATLMQQIARYGLDRMAGEQRRLSNCEALIPSLAAERIGRERRRLDNAGALLKVVAASATSRSRIKLDMLASALAPAVTAAIGRERRRIDHLGELAAAFSPQKTLARGYSVTRLNGSAIRSSSILRPGDRIETLTASGSFTSTVEEISPE